MERIMHERGDLECEHEPFMYDFYLHRQVREMPYFEPDPARFLDYQSIREHLLLRAETTPIFFKDMSYYVVPQIFSDSAFSSRLKNIFLIRDPHRTIPSYFKLDPDLTCEEVGLEAQYRHVQWLIDNTGESPLVLEAEHVQSTPQQSLDSLWEYTGLTPKNNVLEWSEQPPEQWKEVETWHAEAIRSPGIRRPSSSDSSEVFNEVELKRPVLREFLNHHLPFYEKLKGIASAQRLQASVEK
ncbi:MAG: hypothetical protein ACI9FD_001167 [Gammaproteobacteria bacterium]|jgi:hypothetical protein